MAVNMTLKTAQSVSLNWALNLTGTAESGVLQHVAEEDAAEQARYHAIII
jgi:hypothetical protein